jgi:hypothetical protein
LQARFLPTTPLEGAEQARVRRLVNLYFLLVKSFKSTTRKPRFVRQEDINLTSSDEIRRHDLAAWNDNRRHSAQTLPV